MLAAVLMVTVLTAATGDNIADIVLGQIDFTHGGINNPNATSINTPGQIAIDSNGDTQHLYVADTFNSRVLGWNDAMSFFSGEPADIVIGQPDFQTIVCNSGTAGGDVAGVGADSLCSPAASRWTAAGVSTLLTRATVACSFTQRRSVRQSASASRRRAVYGQTAISLRTVRLRAAATGLCHPQGVAIQPDSNGNLYVADAGNNRVLEFNQPLSAASSRAATAQLVFGQGSPGTASTPICATFRTITRDVQSPYRSPSTVGQICASATTTTIACWNSINPAARTAGNVTADLVFGQD